MTTKKPKIEGKKGVAADLDQVRLLSALRPLKKGDFTVRMPCDQTGIAGEIAEAFNNVVELNHTLIKELQRTSEEAGMEGKERRRLFVPGATGAWAEAVETLNNLIFDLIQPLSETGDFVGTVSKGGLSRKTSKIEEKFTQIFESMNDCVAVYKAVSEGEDFLFLNFNKSAERVENINREDLIGKKVTEIFPGIKTMGLLDVFQRVSKTGVPEHFPISGSSGRLFKIIQRERV